MDPSPERLHKVRIEAKQVRHAAEAPAPVMGRPAVRPAKAAERVQTELGDHHNAVAAEAWLRARAGAGDGAGAVPSLRSAFEAGYLAASVHRRPEVYERQWNDAWETLAQPKRVRWLH